MSIRSALSVVAVADLAAATPYYERLFGRPADAEPMPGLAQWVTGSGGVQVVEQPEHAGHSMVTLLVDDFDAALTMLRDGDFEPGEVVDGVLSRLTTITDPAGNVITLAETPAEESGAEDAGGELLGIARFTFHEGGYEEWRRLSERCMEIVRTQDTGTLQYDIYVDDAHTAAVVIERYVDSAALAEHLEHIGPELMQAITATGTVVGETLGHPSPELRANIEPGGPVRLLTPLMSL